MKTKTAARPYRQRARAEAAEATYNRILDALMARLTNSWFEEITLEALAGDAGVTVQTVVRRFGGKEGVLEAARDRLGKEISMRRASPVGDIDQTAEHLIKDYEITGDVVMRLLMQEGRYPAIKSFTDDGRRYHRAWVERTFAPQLAKWRGAARTMRIDMLVIATDIYLWQLVRRDMARPIAHYRKILLRQINAALADA